MRRQYSSSQSGRGSDSGSSSRRRSGVGGVGGRAAVGEPERG